MVIECFAIIALILILIFATARTGRAAGAFCLLPLISVPTFYLAGIPVSRLLAGTISREILVLIFTVIGVCVGCVLFGMLAGNFKTTRARRAYLLVCGGFSVILAATLIYDLFFQQIL